MQELFVYSGRPDSLTLDEATRLAPPGMVVRRAEALDGFVFDARDLCFGVFVAKKERVDIHLGRFTDNPSEIRPVVNPFLDTRRVLLSSDLLARLRSFPRALEVSFMRGSADDPRACAFVPRLLDCVEGLLESSLGRLSDARGVPLSAGPPEIQVEPPAEARVTQRALCLAAVLMRGEIDDGPADEAGALLSRLRRWVTAAGLDAELEPHERATLDAPLGSLTSEQRVTASWQAEGLGALAWALGVAELPAFDVPIDGPQVATRLQFLSEPLRPAPGRLRADDERATMADRAFAVHWRLQEFLLSREVIDFAAVAREVWFGPLDLTGLPLVRTGNLLRRRLDLAVGGKPLTKVSEQELLTCLRITEERGRALNWLVTGGVYSMVDTST